MATHAQEAAPEPKDYQERVLLVVPAGTDPALSPAILAKAGIPSEICAGLREATIELASGAAAMLLTEEAFSGDNLQYLLDALHHQPAWSDLPVVFVAQAGADSAAAAGATKLLGNVTVLERPVRSAALLSALRTAVRARQRQYRLRDQMEALHRSEERFVLATQATQDVIWDADLVTGAPGARTFARPVFGWDPAEFEGDGEAFKSRLHPDDRERMVASLQAALAGSDSTWDDEYRFRDAGGVYIHVVDRCKILRNATGQAVRTVGAMMDITERKLSEQARALHTSIVESSDDAIISKTLDGIIRSWNPGAERLFGYRASEAIGRHITLIIPIDRLDEEVQIAERLRLGERIDHYETTRVTKYGRQVNISLTVSPLWDGNGQVVGASKVARDITARKRVQEELRRQDERLQLLWETASILLTTDKPEAMLRGVFDKIAPHFQLDAYLSYMLNDSGDTLLLESSAGIRDDQLNKVRRVEIGSGICGMAAKERRPISATYIQQSNEEPVQVLKSLGISAYASNPLIAANRLLGTLSFASRRKDEFDPDEIEFLQTICRYVTAAYERVRLIRELRDTDQRKDEFLATLAHELRNPLAPIRNALEIMRLSGVDAATVQHAARTMIERQLGQMVRLIDDLLDVSRITTGRLGLRKGRIDLDSVIKAAIDTSRPLIEASAHELTIELPNEPVFLDADAVRLAQVFSNLLNNSARYTSRGGQIRLTAQRLGDEIAVTVRDSGIGIPREALPTIFDMFTQVDTSAEQSQGGLGIGLTLVKRLVELHGGKVEARSEGLGKGAEFAVQLPVAEAPVGAHAAPQQTHKREKLHGETCSRCRRQS